MLLKECYDAFGGNYEDVRQRIPKDEVITKFLIKFLSDTSYDDLCRAMESDNYRAAFRAAHSIKGICLNLAIQRLGNSAGTLTELLRGSDKDKFDRQVCDEAFQQMSADYREVVEAVRKLMLHN